MEAFNVELIKKLLKERKISYPNLSKMSGIPKSTISQIMCGYISNPRIDTIEAIYNALGLLDNDTEENIDAKLIEEIQKLSPEQLALVQSIINNFDKKK